MSSKSSFYTTLVLVVAVHLAVIAAIVVWKTPSIVEQIEPPAILGVLVSPEVEQPQVTPAPVPPQPTETKPLPEKKILTTQAPSQHQVQDAPVETKKVDTPEPPKSNAEPVSEQVVLPHTDASHINNPAPTYPPMSRRMKEQGVVLLELLVLSNGTVGELRLKTSSGYSRLDQAALAAVKNWHFVPAKRGEQNIDLWYELPVEFSLK